MIKLAIFSLVVLITPMAFAKECDTNFEAVLKRHISAVDARDVDTYIATIAPREQQMMILPDGSYWQSISEIREGHVAWFSDTTWSFNRTLIRKDVRANWGVVVYQATVDRPDKAGAPFLLSLLFAPEEDGCWYLQHDQNTLLPTE